MLFDQYQTNFRQSDFCHDPSQDIAANQLMQVQQELIARYDNAHDSIIHLRFFLTRKEKFPIKGVYMWGGVGRGKTYLMDLFFESLPFRRKLRLHLHHLMQRVHNELNEMRGIQNPLEAIASHLHQESVVICLDEFIVSDITDAMILRGLIEGLFRRGVTLIVTSNTEPDRLYWNGQQRERFLPAISAIKQYMTVLNVDNGIDYRLRKLDRKDYYFFPLGDAAESHIEDIFNHLSKGESISYNVVIINHRELIIRGCTKNVLWCNYDDLCNKPRSTEDYIELSRRYQTVILSNVPQMGDLDGNSIRRFINLVDELYDRSINLAISAAIPIGELYAGTQFKLEFERTTSRLLEMQSPDYLTREGKH